MKDHFKKSSYKFEDLRITQRNDTTTHHDRTPKSKSCSDGTKDIHQEQEKFEIEHCHTTTTTSSSSSNKRIKVSRSIDEHEEELVVPASSVTTHTTTACSELAIAEKVFDICPLIWTFLTTHEHFLMSSTCKSIQQAALNPITNMWRLRHVRQYWSTAQEFYPTDLELMYKYNYDDDLEPVEAPVTFQDTNARYHHSFLLCHHWHLFTRSNVMRIVHYIPHKVGCHRNSDGSIDYDTYFTTDEKVTVYETSEECERARRLLTTQSIQQQNQFEIQGFDTAYFQDSVPTWTFVLENHDEDKTMTTKEGTITSELPIYASKVGGVPAMYPSHYQERSSTDNENTNTPSPGFKGSAYWRRDQRSGRGRGKGGVDQDHIFLFQIDLSTVPIRLREHLGFGSGLLQIFLHDDESELAFQLIPPKDFSKLVIDPDSHKVLIPEVSIVDWVERYDLPTEKRSESRVKFGGYGLDVHDGDTIMEQESQCDECGRKYLSSIILEIRGESAFDYTFGKNIQDLLKTWVTNTELCGCLKCQPKTVYSYT